ncbi:polycystic kidney disease protein 1-like 2 isoform X1 [Hippocampus zosterae]|uniref:polycystic kidney disease protein 1-like 2 isoform X1 n=1 Tax=Hippocampus zosterae TaxID=109293 RepID=UPI00223D80D0|nr:polycystic kidney disease protein 1-like 2 isoform X1 [Hippocampus zosterae]
MFIKLAVFSWVASGYLTEPTELCQPDRRPPPCEHVFQHICYEIWAESKSWTQARSSCAQRGGRLLREFNDAIKMILNDFTRQRNIGNLTWWLGQRDREDNLEALLGDYENVVASKDATSCTYVKHNPFQLVVSSDCNQKRGFLCTHSLQSSQNTQENLASGSRFKRSEHPMAAHIYNIVNLLLEADNELMRMETEAGEPTDGSRDGFIRYLLKGTQNLTPELALENIDVISHIIGCSMSILDMSMNKCDIQANPNPTSLFEDIFEIFRTISVLLGSATSERIVIKHSTGSIYLSSHNPEDLSNVILGSVEDGEFIIMPPYSVLQSHIGRYEKIIAQVCTRAIGLFIRLCCCKRQSFSSCFACQMATFSVNPHPTDDKISGTVCSLLLSDGESDVELSNLTEMIEIFMPRPIVSTVINQTVVLEENAKVLTRVNVSDPTMSVCVRVEPSGNVSLILTLSEGSPPNSSYFANITILNQIGGYQWILTPEMLRQTPGVWYISSELFNSTWEPGIALSITTFMTKCMHWSIDQQTWSTDGCQVGKQSTPRQTHCLCNHLTLFGGSFFVMPNYVDLTRTAELFGTVSQNYVVLSLLCAFFSLYLVTLLWACYADRRSRSRRKMTLLKDNHPCAQYNYLIGVQTGQRKNAGTTASVTVTMIGSEGQSDAHHLADPDKLVFERGAVDMFLLATPFPLGQVRNIRLQHDNSGGHPSWYINKVTIQDLQTQHVWHFFCDCWISSNHGDGMAKKIFNAAKSNEVSCFRNIFQSRTSTGFRDEHIWMSIVDPPWRSPFTRVQRVSCCMSLLLCTMAINIAFWNVPENEDSPVVFSIGSLRITWQDVMVGVESGLLMFPINILIITIFRSIKPRIVSKSPKNCSEDKVRPQLVTITTILKETDEVLSLLSRSLRNKMAQMYRLESITDLFAALKRVHELIHLMQGETESDLHWVYCSKFLLAALCRVRLCLETLDGKNFPSPQDYAQALDITNLLVRKADMVFSSHLACCPPPVKKKSVSSGCWLPWWCVFIGWFLLISLSGVSTFFTLLYGFYYGKAKSIKWIMSLGLSLFQSIVILQPLKVIGVAVFFALLLKPVAVEEIEEIEQVLSEQQDKCRRYSRGER